MVLPGSVSKNINSMRYIRLPVIIRNSSINLCSIVALERSNSVTVLDSVKSADYCGQLKLESSDLLCPSGSHWNQRPCTLVPSTAMPQGLGFPQRARGVTAIQLIVQMKSGQNSRLFLLCRVPRAFHYISL